MDAHLALLAQSPPPTTAGAGAVGLFIWLAMAAVTALLILNMSRRLKRLPSSFTPEVERRTETVDETTGTPVEPSPS